jgi:hypothetical protein
MPVSQAQIVVWKARAQLDRKLARMTPSQRQEYLDGVFQRVKKKLGIDLDLPVAESPPRQARFRRGVSGRATPGTRGR